jgi:hypothetical protein
MNNTIRVLTAAMMLFGAWSAQAEEPAPPATTTAQPSTTEAPGPAAGQPAKQAELTAPATSAAATKPEAASTALSITDEDKRMIRQGYQIRMRDGEKLYCKRQTTSGSRLNTKDVCLRSDELKAMREDAQDAMREKIRNNKSN